MGLIIIPGQGQEPEPEPEREEFVEIPPEEVDHWVRHAIARNRKVRRETRSQEALDRCVEVLHEEGEVYLAAGLLHLMAFRIADRVSIGLSVLMSTAAELRSLGAFGLQCRVCGCTDASACEGGCSWVEFDLCSRCAARLKAMATRAMGPDPGRDG
jgi:hypothetical protein